MYVKPRNVSNGQTLYSTTELRTPRRVLKKDPSYISPAILSWPDSPESGAGLGSESPAANQSSPATVLLMTVWSACR